MKIKGLNVTFLYQNVEITLLIVAVTIALEVNVMSAKIIRQIFSTENNPLTLINMIAHWQIPMKTHIQSLHQDLFHPAST